MSLSILMMAIGIFLFGTLGADNSPAQDKADTGRHKAPPRDVVDTGRQSYWKKEETSRWEIQINGGLFKGGDLFRAGNNAEEPVAWVPVDQGDWLSTRIKVSLESSFAAGLQIQRRMGDWYCLRAGLSYSDVEMVAEAPIDQGAEIFPFDTAGIWLFSLGTEVRLTSKTPSYPYLAGDLMVVGFSPERSGFLAQTNLGARVALGFHHQFDPIWSFSLEGGLIRSAFGSAEFPLPEGVEPQNLEYENANHLIFFEAKFALGVRI